MESHAGGKDIITVKLRATIGATFNVAPLTVDSAVHASLKEFSLGSSVASYPRSTNAVNRLVRMRRKELMEQRFPG